MHRKVALSLVLLVIAPRAVLAQEPAPSKPQATEAAKVENAKEEKPERTDDRREGVRWGGYPIFQYSSDAGFTTGLLGQRFDYADNVLPYSSLLTLQASYATVGSRGLLATYEKTNLGKHKLRARTGVVALINDRKRYYGVGDRTTIDTALEADNFYFYRFDRFSVFQTVRKDFGYGFDVRLGLQFDYLFVNANQTNSQYFQDFGSGLQRDFITQIVLGAVWERRNFEIIPDRGYFLSSSFTISPGFLSTEESYLRFDSDFRYYLPILHDRWLWLAFQTKYSANTSDTPFYQKVILGSDTTLRGLRGGRFISDHAWTLRGEIRTMLLRFRVFDMPLKGGGGFFLDTGRVGDDFSRLFMGKQQVAYGITLFGSYFTDDFIGHADLAFSDEGSAIYLGLGHVF